MRLPFQKRSESVIPRSTDHMETEGNFKDVPYRISNHRMSILLTINSGLNVRTSEEKNSGGAFKYLFENPRAGILFKNVLLLQLSINLQELKTGVLLFADVVNALLKIVSLILVINP